MLIDDHRDDELRNEIIHVRVAEAEKCRLILANCGLGSPEGDIAKVEFEFWRRAVYQARDGDLSEVRLPYC